MDNNPLKQYFRRPSVFIKLPSGGVGYPEGSLDTPVNGEFPVYPMTAIDEISAKTPDALFNGNAVVDLIKSCIPNIKDPWETLSNDLDAILIAIKAAGGGDSLEITSKCPKCENEGTFAINLVGLLSTLKSGDYTKELSINDLKIKFKPNSFKIMNKTAIEQVEVQKLIMNIEQMENNEAKLDLSKKALARITELTMDILSKAIEYIKTPTQTVTETNYILDFFKNCDKNTYNTIKDHNASLKSATELKPLDIKCVSCGHEYKQAFTLNPSDFFG